MTKDDAIKLIKAFGDYLASGNPIWDTNKVKEAFDMAIEALGQPEIIHCKNCEYNESSSTAGNAWCNKFYGMTNQMGFCHYGERRTDE